MSSRDKIEVILDEELKDEIWDIIYSRYKFYPTVGKNTRSFTIKEEHNIYEFGVWNDEKEVVVNNIFKNLSEDTIYALDWNHDCYIFNPHDNIELETWWHDEIRDCNVYFPSYYPDGDYYFFIAKDFSYAWLGHPWHEKGYVVGERLISEVEKYKDDLDLK